MGLFSSRVHEDPHVAMARRRKEKEEAEAIERKRRKEMVTLERAKHSQRAAVEDFIQHVYHMCKRSEAMWMILSSKFGQIAFRNFAKGEHADQFLEIFLDVSRILAVIETTANDDLLEKMKYLLEQHFSVDHEDENVHIPSTMLSLLRNTANMDPHSEEEDFKETTKHVLTNLEREMVNIMARDQFDRFISGRHYRQFRSSARSVALAATPRSHAAADEKWNTSSKVKERELANSSSSKRVVFMAKHISDAEDTSDAAFSNFDKGKFHEILGSDTWLGILVAATESLPISFSLCLVDKLSGFPIVYVNKYWEKTYGYSHQEIMGRNFKDFMQCDETDPEHTAVLSKGLGSQDEAVVVLKNKTKNGKIIDNLIAVKPIMNEYNKYTFVIGLHFDVTGEHIDHSVKINLVEKLLHALPDTVLRNADGDPEVEVSERSTGSSHCSDDDGIRNTEAAAAGSSSARSRETLNTSTSKKGGRCVIS